MERRRILGPVLALLLLGSGCGGGESAQGLKEEKAQIRASLEKYLPRLAEAYATGNMEVLEGLAAEKEIAQVSKRIADLRLEGRQLEPSFQQITLEDVTVWGYANAYATTVEIWDIRVYATGVHELIAEDLDQRRRYKYQLKREEGDRWKVLFRTVQE